MRTSFSPWRRALMTAIPIFKSKNLKRNVYGIEIDGKVHLDKIDSRPRIVQYLINYIYIHPPITYITM